MKKTLKNSAWVLFLLAIIVGVELMMPKKLNWRKSFVHTDRIPYGCFVLYELLKDFFKESIVTINRVSFYELFAMEDDDIFASHKTILLVNENFKTSETDLEALSKMVQKGTVVFIAAHTYHEDFCEFFQLDTYVNFFIVEEEASLDSIQLIHPRLPEKFFHFKRGMASYAYFSKLPSHADILGENSTHQPNFVRIPHGKGYFFLHTAPLAFTNYGILSEDNKDYVAAVLSCLPFREEVIWDEYYKIGREEIKTPLRFILSQEPLRWAYYVSIFGLLLFVFFKAKRVQRVIPEIPPLQNTTLEFAETVALLYYHHGDHKNLAQKMILFWKDYLRNKHFLKTDVLDEQFAQQLSEKLKISLEKIKLNIQLIKWVENQPKISEETLITLYKALNNFKKPSI